MTSEQEPARDRRPIEPERRDVTVRRAPKFAPFIFVWAVLGVVLAAVSAYTGPENEEFTRGTIFAFLAVLFGLAGILVGSLLFLLIDRASVKRAKHVTAVAEPGQEDSADSAADPGPAGLRETPGEGGGSTAVPREPDGGTHGETGGETGGGTQGERQA
jgi:hypothetical protein